MALANGCFDVCTWATCATWRARARKADLLVVGVNADDSVRRLKGEGRPVLPAADRALLVAALRAVDHVVVFAEDDVKRLLLALRPDVHCKGTDYTPDTVPERDVVRSYGGRVASSAIPSGTTRACCSSASRADDEAGGRAVTEAVFEVLVVRLSAVGDVVHTLPVAAALLARGWPHDLARRALDRARSSRATPRWRRWWGRPPCAPGARARCVRRSPPCAACAATSPSTCRACGSPRPGRACRGRSA